MCLKETGNEGVKWIHLAQTGASGHDTTTNGFHKTGKLLDWPTDCQPNITGVWDNDAIRVSQFVLAPKG